MTPRAVDAAAGPRLLKRGGRRDRGRERDRLIERECRDLIAAAHKAWGAGCPFNRFVTLAWVNAGIGQDAVAVRRVTAAWLKLARDWLGARGHRPLVWAWVMEDGANRGGLHIHLLMHVPNNLAPLFSPMPRRWVKQLTPGGRYVPRTLDTKKFRTADPGASDAARVAYAGELNARLHYMLKAAPMALEGNLGVEGWRWPDAPVWGQHCQISGARIRIWQGWRQRTES
jgi:hypothetical protein